MILSLQIPLITQAHHQIQLPKMILLAMVLNQLIPQPMLQHPMIPSQPLAIHQPLTSQLQIPMTSQPLEIMLASQLLPVKITQQLLTVQALPRQATLQVRSRTVQALPLLAMPQVRSQTVQALPRLAMPQELSRTVQAPPQQETTLPQPTAQVLPQPEVMTLLLLTQAITLIVLQEIAPLAITPQLPGITLIAAQLLEIALVILQALAQAMVVPQARLGDRTLLATSRAIPLASKAQLATASLLQTTNS
jgi:hypothetical protein